MGARCSRWTSGEQFDEIEDPYLRERKADVVQVVERVLKAPARASGALRAAVARSTQTILVAHDLSPADVIQFKQHQLRGLPHRRRAGRRRTRRSSRAASTSRRWSATHNARQLIRENELLIVDGTDDVVIVDPDRAVLAEYRLKQSELRAWSAPSSSA